MDWIKSNDEKYYWVEKFKDVLINQKREEIGEIFDLNGFGIHNSLSLDEYCQHEFEEFNLKCEKFGLTMEAPFVCYDLPSGLFYFSIGKKDDLAVFEGIFGWSNDSKKAIGNQYKYKIEPKIQFIKTINKSNEELKIIFKRRINIKGQKHTNINKVISKMPHDEDILAITNLDDVFGGKFYNYSYKIDSSELESTWEPLKIYEENCNSKHELLMRGIDHPLFIDNLYPEILKDGMTITIKHNCWPVIINVILDDNTEHYYKYPREKEFKFDKEIKTVCLTDNLSFDWIVTKDKYYE